MAVVVSLDRFEDLVADALDEIPPDLAGRMENVVVLVAERPSPDQQRHHSGVTLLGLYEGTPLTRRRLGGPTLPDRITIFRRALCRLAADEDDLRERIRTTVLHEVAHHFGIDDARLADWGWTDATRHRRPGEGDTR